MLGIAHRVGTLEVGKDCDLIVTDGDILHYKSFVQWAVIDGKQVYDKERELFYAQIRPRPVVAVEEKKIDKGETPAKPEDKKDVEKTDGEKKEDGEKKDKPGRAKGRRVAAAHGKLSSTAEGCGPPA
jgi:hypothetical protein